MKKVWFITGSSSGLGKNLANEVLLSGDIVIATAREPKKNNDLAQRFGDQVYSLQLDVTDYNRIHQVVQDVLNKFGRIDVLVNNAGFGITGATEAFTPEQVQEQFAANLLAPIEICRAILPHMREQKSGRIFNISSIGGRVTSIGLAIYQSAKFGLSGFSEALSKEVAPLGIKVTVVEPGGIQTNWGGSSMTFARMWKDMKRQLIPGFNFLEVVNLFQRVIRRKLRKFFLIWPGSRSRQYTSYLAATL